MSENQSAEKDPDHTKKDEKNKSLLDLIDKTLDYPVTKRVAESVDPKARNLTTNKNEATSDASE